VAINGNLFKRHSNWIILHKRRFQRECVTRVLNITSHLLVCTVALCNCDYSEFNNTASADEWVAVELIALIDLCGVPRACTVSHFAPLSCTLLSRGRGDITVLISQKLFLEIDSSGQNIVYFIKNIRRC